jgi:hypothetical protein
MTYRQDLLHLPDRLGKNQVSGMTDSQAYAEESARGGSPGAFFQ